MSQRTAHNDFLPNPSLPSVVNIVHDKPVVLAGISVSRQVYTRQKIAPLVPVRVVVSSDPVCGVISGSLQSLVRNTNTTTHGVCTSSQQKVQNGHAHRRYSHTDNNCGSSNRTGREELSVLPAPHVHQARSRPWSPPRGNAAASSLASQYCLPRLPSAVAVSLTAPRPGGANRPWHSRLLPIVQLNHTLSSGNNSNKSHDTRHSIDGGHDRDGAHSSTLDSSAGRSTVDADRATRALAQLIGGDATHNRSLVHPLMLSSTVFVADMDLASCRASHTKTNTSKVVCEEVLCGSAKHPDSARVTLSTVHVDDAATTTTTSSGDNDGVICDGYRGEDDVGTEVNNVAQGPPWRPAQFMRRWGHLLSTLEQHEIMGYPLIYYYYHYYCIHPVRSQGSFCHDDNDPDATHRHSNNTASDTNRMIDAHHGNIDTIHASDDGSADTNNSNSSSIREETRNDDNLRSSSSKVNVMNLDGLYHHPSLGGISESLAMNYIRGSHIAYRYEILDVLGQGTFATVVRARDHAAPTLWSYQRRCCALKIYRTGAEYTAVAQAEVAAWRQVNHVAAQRALQGDAAVATRGTPMDSLHQDMDSAIFIQDWCTSSTRTVTHFTFRRHCILVLPLYGMDLGELLRVNEHRALPRPVVRSFVAQLVHGLHILHDEAHLTHADIKADNVMLADRSDVDWADPDSSDVRKRFVSVPTAELSLDGITTRRSRDGNVQHGVTKAAENGPSADAWTEGLSRYAQACHDIRCSGSHSNDSVLLGACKAMPDSDSNKTCNDNNSNTHEHTSLVSTRVKMIDLGSALPHIPREMCVYPVQTLPYRAPEAALRLSYHCSIDMWSVGCLVYELSTGQPLFAACSDEDLLARHVHVLGMPDAPFREMLKQRWCAYRAQRMGDVSAARLSFATSQSANGAAAEEHTVWDGHGDGADSARNANSHGSIGNSHTCDARRNTGRNCDASSACARGTHTDLCAPPALAECAAMQEVEPCWVAFLRLLTRTSASLRGERANHIRSNDGSNSRDDTNDHTRVPLTSSSASFVHQMSPLLALMPLGSGKPHGRGTFDSHARRNEHVRQQERLFMLDFILGCLYWSSSERLSACEALDHPYLSLFRRRRRRVPAHASNAQRHPGDTGGEDCDLVLANGLGRVHDGGGRQPHSRQDATAPHPHVSSRTRCSGMHFVKTHPLTADCADIVAAAEEAVRRHTHSAAAGVCTRCVVHTHRHVCDSATCFGTEADDDGTQLSAMTATATTSAVTRSGSGTKDESTHCMVHGELDKEMMIFPLQEKEFWPAWAWPFTDSNVPNDTIHASDKSSSNTSSSDWDGRDREDGCHDCTDRCAVDAAVCDTCTEAGCTAGRGRCTRAHGGAPSLPPSCPRRRRETEQAHGRVRVSCSDCVISQHHLLNALMTTFHDTRLFDGL